MVEDATRLVDLWRLRSRATNCSSRSHVSRETESPNNAMAAALSWGSGEGRARAIGQSVIASEAKQSRAGASRSGLFRRWAPCSDESQASFGRRRANVPKPRWISAFHAAH